MLRKIVLTWNEGKDLGAAALGRCEEVKEESWGDEGSTENRVRSDNICCGWSLFNAVAPEIQEECRLAGLRQLRRM